MKQLNLFDQPKVPVKQPTQKKPKKPTQQKLNKEEEDILKQTVHFLFILMAKRIQKGETKPTFVFNINEKTTGIVMSINVKATKANTTPSKAKLFIEK